MKLTATMERPRPEPPVLTKDEQVGLLSFVLGLILAGPAFALRGWVLQTLWGWFVTPAFAVPAPSVALCVGLAVLVAALTPGRGPSKSKSLLAVVFDGVVYNLLGLGIGYVVHLFA